MPEVAAGPCRILLAEMLRTAQRPNRVPVLVAAQDAPVVTRSIAPEDVSRRAPVARPVVSPHQARQIAPRVVHDEELFLGQAPGHPATTTEAVQLEAAQDELALPVADGGHLHPDAVRHANDVAGDDLTPVSRDGFGQSRHDRDRLTFSRHQRLRKG